MLRVLKASPNFRAELLSRSSSRSFAQDVFDDCFGTKRLFEAVAFATKGPAFRALLEMEGECSGDGECKIM